MKLKISKFGMTDKKRNALAKEPMKGIELKNWS
jgi:hypothetical protein